MVPDLTRHLVCMGSVQLAPGELSISKTNVYMEWTLFRVANAFNQYNSISKIKIHKNLIFFYFLTIDLQMDRFFLRSWTNDPAACRTVFLIS